MKARFLQSAGVAALPAITVCVFTPLLIYFGNTTEFTASLAEIYRAYLPYLLVIVIAFGVLGIVLSKAGHSRLIAVGGALTVLMWLQANILVWDYGPLDGRSINWFLGISRGLLDSLIWIAVIAFAVVRHRTHGRLLIHVAVAALLMQVLTAGMLLVGDKERGFAASNVEQNRVAKKGVMRFSESFNVVHIVMDGFQSDIFAAILKNPENHSYKDQLRGFTFFENNIGPYPYTQMTVPALLSGRLYQNHVPVDEFVDAAFAGQNVLRAATDAGFEVDIAAPVALKNIYAKSRHAYAYGVPLNGNVSSRDLIANESARLMDLTLFRVLPHFAKAMIHRDDLWLFQSRGNTRSFMHLQYFADLAFIRDLTQNLEVDRKAPVYKMMHFMLSHWPTVGNRNCEHDGRRSSSRENVTNQARCGLSAILDLFEEMKKQDIYDRSLIVMMADHGAWVRVEGIDTADRDDTLDSLGIAQAIPVLAIKRPGDQNAFAVSKLPTSIIDVPATIADVLDIDATFPGIPIFTMDAEKIRERRHYTYSPGNNPDHEGYLNPMQEYVVSGSPLHAESWRAGKRYSPQSID